MTRLTKIVILTGILAAVLSPVLQFSLTQINYVAGALAYLLVLTVFGAGLWISLRLTRREFGWRWGRLSDFRIALIYPALVIGSLAVIAILSGSAVELSSLNFVKIFRDIAIMGAATFIGVLITEEGFFRGALWGAAQRAKWTTPAILLWTTLCFVAWHIAVPFVDENYKVPLSIMPVYFANATLISLAFGLLRIGAGSIVIASVAHSMWNGLSYVFFGYGDKAGALGISEFSVFGPERGILGLAVNGVALLLLLIWVVPRLRR